MKIGQPVDGWTLANISTSSDGDTCTKRSIDEHVLAPILTTDEPNITDQLEIARAFAEATDTSLRVTVPIAPDQPSTTLSPRTRDDTDSDLSSLPADHFPPSPSSSPSGLIGVHRLTRTVHKTIAATDVDTVVLPGSAPTSLFAGDSSDRIAAHADCDVVVVNGNPGLDALPSILLPITGGPHSGLAVDTARRLATATDACIDVLHVVETGASDHRREQAEAYLDAAERRLDRPEQTSSWILEADDPIGAITEQSDYYPLTIIGAPTTSRLQRFVSGSTNRAIRSDANSVVISVHNNTGHSSLDKDELSGQ